MGSRCDATLIFTSSFTGDQHSDSESELPQQVNKKVDAVSSVIQPPERIIMSFLRVSDMLHQMIHFTTSSYTQGGLPRNPPRITLHPETANRHNRLCTGRVGGMAHARRVPLRFWCGPLPLHEPPQSEDARLWERDALSHVFFGSDEFSTLRAQLRLKLQEIPLVTQARHVSSSSHYAGAIEIAGSYKRYVVALLRLAAPMADASDSGAVGTSYVPLFFGFGPTDLSSDRLVGKERRFDVVVALDALLVFVLLGQLHALQAEALVEQGLKLESAAIVEAADASWRKSTAYFTHAANTARVAMLRWVAGDPQFATVIRFFTTTITHAIILAHMAQIHRASARIVSLHLSDETLERLARNAVVCARYGYTVTSQLHEVIGILDDSAFSKQLAWLIQSYRVRWRAVTFSYEQTIFQLDFHPEVALRFCEMIQHGERLPGPPEYSLRHDAYFTRIMHDIQHAHTTHLSSGVDEKSRLLSLCQRKLGLTWSPEPLSCELSDAILEIRRLDDLFDEGPMAGFELEETEMDDNRTLSLEMITSNVKRARELAGFETLSLSAHSTIRQTSGDVTHFSNRAATSVSDKGPGNTASHLTPDQSVRNLQPRQFNTHGHQSSSDWVTTRLGEKTLHFEPLPAPSTGSSSTRPPRPATAGSTIERRRNAVPMVIDEVIADPVDSTGAVLTLKPRPASSSSYLSGKKKLPETGSLTWVPTRMACALCERRFMRQNLPGVVVMKRIFDLRRKWGMVLQDSKKFSAASALYGKANVCLMCQDILAFEDDQDTGELESSSCPRKDSLRDDVGALILNQAKHEWHQRPPPSNDVLLDIAANRRARQSSTNFGLCAANAVRADSIRTAHTKEEFQPWWEVDLGNYYIVHSIKVWLREDTGHVSSFGGMKNTTTDSDIARSASLKGKNEADPVISLSSVGYLQSGAGQGLAFGALAPAPQPNNGLYPLHISVSMKTGVDRDLDDILISSVSRHCIEEKVSQPITWLTPPNCRGRFVRVQSESVAFLHIERVNVFITHELPSHSAKLRRETAKTQFKRAAFRASVIGTKKLSRNPAFNEHDAKLTALAFQSGAQPPSNYTKTSNNGTKKATDVGEFKSLVSAFTDPEQAEKRRISRLYLKFKSLLDARTKYNPDERHEIIDE